MKLEQGKLFLNQGNFQMAIEIFLKELEIGNKSKKLFFLLGLAYYELNKFEESIYYYKLALKKDPKSINTIINLATVQFSKGNFLTSENLYLKAIKLDKFNVKAYYGLYLLKPYSFVRKYSLNILEIKKEKKLNLNESYLMEFLLSKIYKNKNDLELELKHLHKYHQECFSNNQNYNLQSLFYFQKFIPYFFDKVNIKNFEVEEFRQEIKPIFIIGLPRSGSTLVESIMSSSSTKLFSLGETSIINYAIINQIKEEIFNKSFDINNYEFNLNFKILKKRVLDDYKNYLSNDDKQIIIIDKSLENFFNIEIILKIFPNALFIHTKRNFKDSIVGIYQSMFENLSWTHSLQEIFLYVDNYIKVIDYFEKKYPSNILSINLEELTFKKIEISKKIFNFCKLQWSSTVLNFYNRKDLNIKTLSNTQLREDIFNYNSKKYEKYFFLLDSFKKKYEWLN